MPVVVVAPGPGGTPTVGEQLRRRLGLADGRRSREPPQRQAGSRRRGRARSRRAPRPPSIALAGSPGPGDSGPGPETLEAWGRLSAEDPALAGQHRRPAPLGTNQVLSGALRADRHAVAARERVHRRGRHRARSRATGRSTPPSAPRRRAHRADRPVDAALVCAPARTDVGPMIVDSAALVPLDSQFTPADAVRSRLRRAAQRDAVVVRSRTGRPARWTGPAGAARRNGSSRRWRSSRWSNPTLPAASWSRTLRAGTRRPQSLSTPTLAGLRGQPALAGDRRRVHRQVPTDEGARGPRRARAGPIAPDAAGDAGRVRVAQAVLGGLQSLIGPADLRSRVDRAPASCCRRRWKGRRGTPAA